MTVHPNGDISGVRINLPMYREAGDRYEAAFDSPCEFRVFIGRFKSRHPAFYWGCRVQGCTTSITACRDCPVTPEGQSAYRELARSKNIGVTNG